MTDLEFDVECDYEIRQSISEALEKLGYFHSSDVVRVVDVDDLSDRRYDLVYEATLFVGGTKYVLHYSSDDRGYSMYLCDSDENILAEWGY